MVSNIAKVLTLLAAASVGSVVAAQSRTLGTGDILKISVYGHPDLESVERVAEDGTISFPLAGAVSVRGLSERDVEQAVASQLAKRRVIRNPDVNVTVQEYQEQRISVLGHVARPGAYGISRDGTLLDVLAEAGGLTEDAGQMAIVTRSGSEAETRVTVDLSELLGRGDASRDVMLSDGDRVYIPRTPRFYIYGQVNRPNAYRLDPGMTVMQAISIAGGLTPKGTERGLSIKRVDPSAEDPATIPAQIGTAIREGDVIYVKESLF